MAGRIMGHSVDGRTKLPCLPYLIGYKQHQGAGHCRSRCADPERQPGVSGMGVRATVAPKTRVPLFSLAEKGTGIVVIVGRSRDQGAKAQLPKTATHTSFYPSENDLGTVYSCAW